MLKKVASALTSLVFVFPFPVFAAWTATDDFDSYANGDNINGKSGGSGWNGNWVVGSGTWTVTNSQAQSGSLSLTNSDFGHYAYRPITSIFSGELVFYMRRDTNTSKAWYFNLSNATTWAGGNLIVCGMEIGNIVCYDNSTQRILVSGFSINTWYKFDITFNGSTYTISINDGASNGPYTYSFGGSGAATYVQFYEGAGGTGTHSVWIDTIGPPTAPVSDLGFWWTYWW